MAKRITIIQGHPDPQPIHLDHALAAAYAQAAEAAGHAVRRITVAELDFPLLRSKADWDREAPDSIRQAQELIGWAEHLVLVYPLWLGGMPALLKGFLEQVMRPGFAFSQPAPGAMGKKLLTGRSARIVVTMGMPAFVYRWYFHAHSLKSLERNILAFVGIKPVMVNLFGMVEGKAARREQWLALMRELGRAGR